MILEFLSITSWNALTEVMTMTFAEPILRLKMSPYSRAHAENLEISQRKKLLQIKSRCAYRKWAKKRGNICMFPKTGRVGGPGGRKLSRFPVL